MKVTTQPTPYSRRFQMTDHLCPMCGYNLEADRVMTRDGFVLDPRGSVSWRGKRLVIKPAGIIVLHTLASTCRPVPRDAMLSRISSSENANLLASTVSQLRKVLRECGAPDPVGVARHAKSLYWQVPVQQ